MSFVWAPEPIDDEWNKRSDATLTFPLFLSLLYRAYHDSKNAAGSEEMHQSEGGFLKPIIFGGLDGTLTAFAIVAGAAGGKLSTGVVLILGFSNILADALSMGVGEFLSSKAENEWILSERRREEVSWQLPVFSGRTTVRYH